jgi:hypothetical protein
MAGLLSKSDCNDSSFQVINRIAIEEIEAWFFGYPDAIRAAYPKVSLSFEKNQISEILTISRIPGKHWKSYFNKKGILKPD